MKLIAIHGFKNNEKELIEFDDAHKTGSRGEDPADKWFHPDGVHKGARFSIGGDKKPAEMKNMQKHLDLIRQLSAAQVIGDGTDEALCKRIDAEVAQDKAGIAEQRKLMAAGGNASVTTQVLEVLAAMGIKFPVPNAAPSGKLPPVPPGSSKPVSA